MGKVGVVIPCYNHGEFLAEALESVTWQTVPVAHTVIVDDGSDKSGDAQAIYSGFRGQIPLNLVCLPYNRGPSHARNVGVEGLIELGCDYILPLDADDVLEAECVETALKTIEGVDIAYPSYVYFGEKRGHVQWAPKPPEEVAEYILSSPMIVNTSLYRKEVWEAVRERNGTGYDPELHREKHYGWEDWLFWIEASLLGFKARAITDWVFRYRVGSGNVDKANQNQDAVWGYFQEKVARLYGVTLPNR
tara:strand:+ start:8549 stop:9292 length:744 start_codon:yes stop_codon:yes gene_type:complete